MSKNKITLAQLLARPDNELRTFDAAQTAIKAGFILEAQLITGGQFYRVQDAKHERGSLRVKVTGVWHRPARALFYRSIAEYNAAVLQRNTNVKA